MSFESSHCFWKKVDVNVCMVDATQPAISVVEGSLNVPYSQNKFDINYNLTDDLIKKSINVSLSALDRAIKNT